jgi:surface antigen
MGTAMCKFIFIGIITGLVSLWGTPLHAGQNQLAGSFMGMSLGGYDGYSFGHGVERLAATETGVFAGGSMANEILRAADHASGLYYNSPAYAYYERRPVYYSSQYYTPNYVALPTPPPPIYVDDDTGNYCREFSQTVRMNGHVGESYGTVCLQPDGSWRVAPELTRSPGK